VSEPNLFDKDYYENGQEKRISGYTNYGWMPERSYPEAASIINHMGWDSDTRVVDFGCAKGYLVYALRQLGVDAWGEDISQYAIENCHPQVEDFVFVRNVPSDVEPDWIIAKDVLEHIKEDDIPNILKDFYERTSDGVLAVIPLGENNKFRIREYEIDVTHVTRRDEGWWTQQFLKAGFGHVRVSYSMDAVKKKWVEPYPYGNGFFVAFK
jgi:SAM-dependent methyltransferase